MAMAATVRHIAAPFAKHLTCDLDFSTHALEHALALAAQIKRAPSRFTKTLAGRYLSLMFEKPSLRTRLTFELAIKQLGGDAVWSIGPIADREPVKDVARNLDRWTHGIVARVFSQVTIEELAKWSRVPVINALSDLYHPCQALADVLTMKERLGDLKGRTVAFVGDGNNVAHSLMLDATRLGMRCAVATPLGYEPNADIVAQAREFGTVFVTHDPAEALRGASAVYTDVWTSMGQEMEAGARLAAFAPYQVNHKLMGLADSGAIFMHCLPAKRGQEVTDEVMESPQSAVFDQAENRLHAQKALLVMLLS
jgi:ornithine carbamoyltransferase